MTTENKPSNLFAKLLGKQYEELPAAIKQFHDTPGHLWKGYVNATGSNNVLAKIIRTFMGFPKPGNNLPITVSVYYTDQGNERWSRSFGNKKFSSLLMIDKKNPQLMSESFGLIKQHYKLELADNWLCWRLQYCSLLGVKLPSFLSPKIIANEGIDEKGTYQFIAKAELPLIGILLEYRGFLNPVL
ncbi:hypothetical protein DKL61_08900 [Gammaproteobacteria bacterium ESL0073]|nr:hypothetical protein DKL61_08900 [Gammaproteobacteria bacterium ESL0073]